MYNRFGLPGLAFTFTSRYSSPRIPPYVGFGCRKCDEPGFLALVLYTWQATMMRNRDRSDHVMIFDRDLHMAAKMAASEHPPQFGSLQVTKSKQSD